MAAKIVRYNGDLAAFASAAPGTERTIFGSIAQANDLTSQINADFLRGWGIVGPSDQPTLEDFNAVGYTLGQLLAYLHQIGIAEYNAAQEYHIGSVCNDAGVVWVSKVNANVGNTPSTSPTQWKMLNEPAEQAFTSPGVTNWIVPAGVTRAWVRVIGGGGGGGKRTAVSNAGSGGGGGGGGIAEGIITVVPGASISVTVGAGGAGATVSNTAGSNGGTSSFGVSISATGGTGGGATAGGGGGLGTGGSFNSSTGTGLSGFNYSNSATVDAGITGAGGGAGGPGTSHSSGSGSSNGNPGVGPGGGGAGAVFNGNGGAGFAGHVLIKY